FPGAETHVTIIDNLVRRDFLYKHPLEELNMLYVLCGLGLILSFALANLGALSGLILTGSMAAGVAMIDKYYLFNNGIVVSIVFPLFLILLLYVGLTFYKYFTE